MPSIFMVLCATAFLLLLVIGTPAVAQLLPAKADSLHSNVLQQERKIDVYLPQESAKDPAARYETLYVLDGDWNAKIVVDVVTFMREVGFLPPLIVVSVPNYFDEHGINSRDHDLTPTSSPDQMRSGGAAQFLTFIKTELLPYVNAHYPTNGVNSIHGHSYGGLFLFYVLMNDPSLFDGYLVLDPAMGWDNHMFDAILKGKLAQFAGKGKAIYIAARSGPAFQYMGMSTIEPIFRQLAPADLHWNITAYPDETHNSLKLKGTYDALKFVFQGYTTDSIGFVPMGGTLIKGKPFGLHIKDSNDRLDLHYTTDGSIPTASSPKFGEFIMVDDAAKTHVRLLSNRGIYDRDLPHHLKNGTALRPSTTVTQTSDDLWHFALYSIDAWPSLGRAKPLRSDAVQHTKDLPPAGRDDFAVAVTRNFVAPADGYYVFYVEATDKARLTVAGTDLIDVDGSQGHHDQAIVMPLRRGTYALRLAYRHPLKNSEIDLHVFQNQDDHVEWWKNSVLRLGDDKAH